MRYNKIEIEGKNWHATHDLEEHIPLFLSVNNDIQLLLNGVNIGNFSEETALPQKAVMHEFMDVVGYHVETGSVIPFGSEPAISRKFEYLNNIIKVTTDINIPRNTSADKFEIDPLKISGNWQKFALIDMSKPTELTWQPIIEDSTIFDSDSHFHIILLEDKDGTRMEIGAGFDLWRWNIGKRTHVEDEKGQTIELKSRFTISYAKNEITIFRQIMSADSEFEIPARSWRFNWYLAFGNTEHPTSNIQHRMKKEEKIIKNSSITVSAEVPPKEQRRKYPAPSLRIKLRRAQSSIQSCLHAKKARNQLRKTLRKMVGQLDDKTIIDIELEPEICYNSSHVAKPDAQSLEHWDLNDIIEFWFWANKRLINKNSCLVVLPPENSIFAEFPSFWTMQGRIKERLLGA